jgi:hypothetical protein
LYLRASGRRLADESGETVFESEIYATGNAAKPTRAQSRRCESHDAPPIDAVETAFGAGHRDLEIAAARRRR